MLFIYKDLIWVVVWDLIYFCVVICIGIFYLYMWILSGVVCVNIFFNYFVVFDFKWNLDGIFLVLKDCEVFCCIFVFVFLELEVDDVDFNDEVF